MKGGVNMKTLITLLMILTLTACKGGGGGGSDFVQDPTPKVDGYFEFVDYECRYLHWYVSGFVYNGQVVLYETMQDCITFGSDFANNPNGGFPSVIDVNNPDKMYAELDLHYDVNEPPTELNGMQVYVDFEGN